MKGKEDELLKQEQELKQIIEQVVARRQSIVMLEETLRKELQNMRPADATLPKEQEAHVRQQQPQARPEPVHAAPDTKKLAEDEMYCSNCNAIISRDAVICYSCGQRVTPQGENANHGTQNSAGDDSRKIIKKKIA